MEIEMYLPYFDRDGYIRQEFWIKSRGMKWKGEAIAKGNIAVSINALKGIIEQSISDAVKGRKYTKVGKIQGYRYRVVLENEEWSFYNTSKIVIELTHMEKREEKLSLRIQASNY